MNDLIEMLDFLSTKGYTPSEFMILYELIDYGLFLSLEEDKKKEVCDLVYREYLKNSDVSIEELVGMAIDHLGELLENGKWDYTFYL